MNRPDNGPGRRPPDPTLSLVTPSGGTTRPRTAEARRPPSRTSTRRERPANLAASARTAS